MSADLCFTTDSFFFFRQLLSELAEQGTKRKSVTCSEVNTIWKCMSEIWGIISPTNRGPKIHFFRGFRNLTATLTAYTFGTKHGVHKQACAYIGAAWCRLVHQDTHFVFNSLLNGQPMKLISNVSDEWYGRTSASAYAVWFELQRWARSVEAGHLPHSHGGGHCYDSQCCQCR